MTDPSKKYLQIDVPRHESAAGTEVGSSFLRIGSPAEAYPMKAILEQIVDDGFIDDGRERGNNEAAATHATVAGAGGTAGPGHALTKAQRKERTDAFLSRGGWHDHTAAHPITASEAATAAAARANHSTV